jgi:hypothetical protein
VAVNVKSGLRSEICHPEFISGSVDKFIPNLCNWAVGATNPWILKLVQDDTVLPKHFTIRCYFNFRIIEFALVQRHADFA